MLVIELPISKNLDHVDHLLKIQHVLEQSDLYSSVKNSEICTKHNGTKFYKIVLSLKKAYVNAKVFETISLIAPSVSFTHIS